MRILNFIHRLCVCTVFDSVCVLQIIQFTGSQESILQLDLDTEDGADGNGNNDDLIRAHSISPTYIIQLDHEVSYQKNNFNRIKSDWIDPSTFKIII